jgi:hypothetical protein
LVILIKFEEEINYETKILSLTYIQIQLREHTFNVFVGFFLLLLVVGLYIYLTIITFTVLENGKEIKIFFCLFKLNCVCEVHFNSISTVMDCTSSIIALN